MDKSKPGLAGTFTLIGEKKPGAGYKFPGFHLVLSIVFGAVIYFLFAIL